MISQLEKTFFIIFLLLVSRDKTVSKIDKNLSPSRHYILKDDSGSGEGASREVVIESIE